MRSPYCSVLLALSQKYRYKTTMDTYRDEILKNDVYDDCSFFINDAIG